ncbi:hypothetical protein TNCV_4258431 [Trichonephila clavipes]|nr:hypothetical protein TNCV_4258431 [Trichonephila clavipes]
MLTVMRNLFFEETVVYENWRYYLNATTRNRKWRLEENWSRVTREKHELLMLIGTNIPLSLGKRSSIRLPEDVINPSNLDARKKSKFSIV